MLEGSGTIELDGESFAIRLGDAILIKPGCRRRAVPSKDTPLQILNVPKPALDPEDEWFD